MDASISKPSSTICSGWSPYRDTSSMPSMASRCGHSDSAEASVCITKASVGLGSVVRGLLSDGGGPAGPHFADCSNSGWILTRKCSRAIRWSPAACRCFHCQPRAKVGVGDDVYQAPSVNKNSPYNGISHFHLNHQLVVVWGGKAQAFSPLPSNIMGTLALPVIPSSGDGSVGRPPQCTDHGALLVIGVPVWVSGLSPFIAMVARRNRDVPVERLPAHGSSKRTYLEKIELSEANHEVSEKGEDKGSDDAKNVVLPNPIKSAIVVSPPRSKPITKQSSLSPPGNKEDSRISSQPEPTNPDTIPSPPRIRPVTRSSTLSQISNKEPSPKLTQPQPIPSLTQLTQPRLMQYATVPSPPGSRPPKFLWILLNPPVRTLKGGLTAKERKWGLEELWKQCKRSRTVRCKKCGGLYHNSAAYQGQGNRPFKIIRKGSPLLMAMQKGRGLKEGRGSKFHNLTSVSNDPARLRHPPNINGTPMFDSECLI
ncbi:hypothetical protein Cgig2_015468 [Carnegiea gigantea]|uniref:Uncharacterized protein n=1 Tax=Carnegiea gigantea TaxID=171969 RepID=A0A9Q1GHD4_9CARY|nr:hypothetical protein Cgig2_015468 [Carnegiea gigantea]